jgi:glycosyltransferase involved in cell wall biosynthesis
MIHNKSIAVVVPAYNEETQIRMVIETMPDFVDRIVIVNDYSKDTTSEIVKSLQGKYFSSIPQPMQQKEKTIYSKAD